MADAIGWRSPSSLSRLSQADPAGNRIHDRVDQCTPSLSRRRASHRVDFGTGRMAADKARAVALALDMIGLPGAVLSRESHILAANPRFEALIPMVVHGLQGRVALVDPVADGRLCQALSRLGVGPTARQAMIDSIPIAAQKGAPAYIVRLVSAADEPVTSKVLSNVAAMLIVTRVAPIEVPKAEILQGLFDLTLAEARVARAIAEGQTLEQIAAKLSVSRETVRTQLKAVLAKTGTCRQVDLVALLACLRLSA